MPRQYSASVRWQIVSRLRSGAPVAAVAVDTGICQATLFRWKHQALVDAGVIEGIPKAGSCLATTNVLERRGLVRWMVRVPSSNPADNGWQISSHIDTVDYLRDNSNWQIVSFNAVCNIEPALIGIYDFAVGSDLQIVRDEQGIHVVDTPRDRKIPHENVYVPTQFRAWTADVCRPHSKLESTG